MRIQKPKVIKYLHLTSISDFEDKKHLKVDKSKIDLFNTFFNDIWKSTSVSQKTSFNEQSKKLLCLLLGAHIEGSHEAEFTIVKCFNDSTDSYIDTVLKDPNYVSVHCIEALSKDGRILMENVYLNTRPKQLTSEIIISQILGELFKEELKNIVLTCSQGEIHKFIFTLKFK